MRQDVRFARDGGVHSAWQVVGDADTDLVVVPPFMSPVGNLRDQPDGPRWLSRLGPVGRALHLRNGVPHEWRPVAVALATDTPATR